MSCLDGSLCVLILFLKKVYLFLERGRERERERNINVCLPLPHPRLRTWPTTQACGQTGNWTGDLLLHSPALSQLNQPGLCSYIILYLGYIELSIFYHFTKPGFLEDLMEKYVPRLLIPVAHEPLLSSLCDSNTVSFQEMLSKLFWRIKEFYWVWYMSQWYCCFKEVAFWNATQ